MNVNSDIDLNENTKCDENFSKDFSACTKIAKERTNIITANAQEFTWKPEKGKNHEREIPLQFEGITSRAKYCVITSVPGF